jgi:hypothetical protein
MTLLNELGINWSIYVLCAIQFFYLIVGSFPGPTNWKVVFIMPIIISTPFITLDFIKG